MLLQATTNTGTVVTFQDQSLPDTSVIKDSCQLQKLLSKSICGAVLFIQQMLPEDNTPESQYPIIQQLLKEHSAIFAEPTDLPPKRSCDHAIPVIPEAKIVNVRPYRIPL